MEIEKYSLNIFLNIQYFVAQLKCAYGDFTEKEAEQLTNGIAAALEAFESDLGGMPKVCGGTEAGEQGNPKCQGKHILTEQKNIKFSKKYLLNIFQSPLY